MALATYSDLQTAISNWQGGRTDLSTYIPDFITLFEAAANRRLRVRAMEAFTLLTTTSGQANLPSDFLTWRYVTWQGNPIIPLEYAHPDYLNYQYDTQQGTPTVFAIIGTVIQSRPYNDASQLGLGYYQKITALSGGVNWLFQNYPDVYLWGSLAESAGFTQDDNALSKWVARRDAVFEEIETLDKRQAGVGGIKIEGFTP